MTRLSATLRWWRTTAICLLTVTALACANESERGDPLRQSGEKADHELFGSCSGSCGAIALDGNCWCDSQCDDFGDCCEDKLAFCAATRCEELGQDDCTARSDCSLELAPDCPNCEGGSLVCVSLPCEELGDDDCVARTDCELGLVPDCPTCEGGTLACIPLPCEELGEDDCMARTDCKLELIPDCPTCEGGEVACVARP